MPELPEVEVLVRALRPLVEGRRIERVRILRDKLVADPTPRIFRARLRGRRVVALRRRAKTIWAELDDGGHWLVHLRMTGWLRHRPGGGRLPDRHVLGVFTLDRGEVLFRDPRRFGRMWWTREPDAHFAPLGPEPLGNRFTRARFAGALARRSIAVKQALLDPRLVAGIGNIYASEACWHARLDPRTPARALDDAAIAKLRTSVRAVLRRAIRLGSTVAPVIEGYRAEARMRDEFRVYGRAGDPCKRCGAPILKKAIAQRSTYFCADCQV